MKRLWVSFVKKTWHKTIVTNNQLPTTTAIRLHSERISFVLELNAGATQSEISNTDHTKHGWKIISRNDKEILIPEWDTEGTKNNLDKIRKAVLKKCGCQKSGCRTASCSCKKSTSFCSNLCTCSNCENRDIGESDEDDADESETEARDTEDDEEDDEIDYAGILNQDGPSSLVEDSALMDGGIDGDVA